MESASCKTPQRKKNVKNPLVHTWHVLKDHKSRSTVTPLKWLFSVFSGVTGLVSTDEKNARNIDVDLWAMTNQETGEYGVSRGFTVSLRGFMLLYVLIKMLTSGTGDENVCAVRGFKDKGFTCVFYLHDR